MRTRIEAVLPKHKFKITASPTLYVVDYKNMRKGGVDILTEEPEGIKYVFLDNRKPTEICFDGFDENALPLPEPGAHNSQCECVIFPSTCAEDDWVLFIEMKYTNDLKTAFDEEIDYPHNMVDQIIKTVKYFRDNGIIAIEKKVHAIVSFPNLIDEFNSTFFSGDLSPEDIMRDHKIIIRATNSATIISEKRLKLNLIE